LAETGEVVEEGLGVGEEEMRPPDGLGTLEWDRASAGWPCDEWWKRMKEGPAERAKCQRPDPAHLEMGVSRHHSVHLLLRAGHHDVQQILEVSLDPGGLVHLHGRVSWS
jgi:hypothetical protein